MGKCIPINKNLMHIVTDFYTNLYTPSPVEGSVQKKLLGNVDRTLTAPQQAMPDAPLSAQELQQAVYETRWVYGRILQNVLEFN